MKRKIITGPPKILVKKDEAPQKRLPQYDNNGHLIREPSKQLLNQESNHYYASKKRPLRERKLRVEYGQDGRPRVSNPSQA